VTRPFFSDDAQLAYAHGASNVPLIGATIGDVFDRVAERQQDREALICCHQNLRYTYGQLKAEVDRFARGLMALGIHTGERLGIWSPNHAEWIVTQYATAKIGAILVNINPAYRGHELEYALNQSGCSSVIIAPPFKTTDYASLLGEVCPELSRSESGRLHAERLPDLRRVIAFGRQHVPGAYHWDDVLTIGDEVEPAELAARQREQQFDSPINIQYTSGTTGFPKGATLSHHSILNNALGFGDYLRFTEQDRLCVTFPFYHCGGMVLSSLCCVATGAAMVLPAPVFDAGTTLEAIDRERCTALHGVPTVFIAALNHPDFERFDVSSLRVGLMVWRTLPARSDEAGQHANAPTRHRGRLRYDRDVARFGDDAGRRAARTPGVDGWPGVPTRRVEDRRSTDRAHRRAGRSGRAAGARLQRDAWLLEQPDCNHRSDRRRALDAHGRPGDDGRRGLREHCGAVEGDDYPRR